MQASNSSARYRRADSDSLLSCAKARRVSQLASRSDPSWAIAIAVSEDAFAKRKKLNVV